MTFTGAAQSDLRMDLLKARHGEAGGFPSLHPQGNHPGYPAALIHSHGTPGGRLRGSSASSTAPTTATTILVVNIKGNKIT
jgi:hypothetical protein